MQVDVKNLAGEIIGSTELKDSVFGVEVRSDVLQRVVVWQLAKRGSPHVSQGSESGPCDRELDCCLGCRRDSGKGSALLAPWRFVLSGTACRGGRNPRQPHNVHQSLPMIANHHVER